MGNAHSPEQRLEQIDRETNSLRASLRGSRRHVTPESKETMVRKLAKKSEEVSELKSKVKKKHVNKSLKNIAEAMSEVLEIDPRESQLDQATVETDSFIKLPVNKTDTSNKNTYVSNNNNRKTNLTSEKNEPTTLQGIQAKVSTMKPQISTAIDNKDVNQLRVYQRTIKILAEELEMLDIQKGTPLAETKKAVSDKLRKLYQKIQKTTDEIKRNDNIQYLTKQNQKDQAVKDLEDIEKRLVENESLLDWALKNNEHESIETAKKMLVEVNQRLSAVDILDTETKEKKIQLSQKITNSAKEIDLHIKKRDFEYHLYQAKTSYQEIANALANGDNRMELKDKLENLHSFVNNLEEYDSVSRAAKQDLLTTIERSISTVNLAIQKVDEQKVVKDIVEQNVVLRKKQRRSNEVTQIDQFYNYWNNVKTNFDPTAYSEVTLSRVEALLEDMKASIDQLESKIQNKRNSRSNLLTQQSQSVPKLNKPLKQSYGSSVSLDTDGVIKARVKYYNTTTPENVNDQLRRNYDQEKNRFSKIEEIKTQIYYIREKLDEIADKEKIKDKLDTYLTQIQSYSTDTNQRIASNAQIVINDILALKSKLDTPIAELTNGQMVTENFGEVLTEVQSILGQLNNEIENFSGSKTDSDYERLKLALFELKDKLNATIIPSHYKKMIEHKGAFEKRISYYLQILDNKVTSQLYSENEIINEMTNKLSRLKGKVERFKGTYRGVLYNQIEMGLNKLLLDVEQVQDKEVANDIITQTEKYLKILEQRSSMAQSLTVQNLRTSGTHEQVAMGKIKDDLVNIKNEINSTPENQVDSFIGLKSRLDLVNLELDQINAKSCDNLEKEKDFFANEVQSHLLMVNAKIALGQQPVHHWSLTGSMESQLEPKLDSIKELADITQRFNSLREGVNRFFGSYSDYRYSQLDNGINELISKTDQFRFIKGTDLYEQKTALLSEMHSYHKMLERKADETEFIERAEYYIHDIEKSINAKDKKTDQIEEQALAVQQKLLSAHLLSDNMSQRKSNCLRKISEILEKIKQQKDTAAKEVEEKKKLEEIEEKLRLVKPEIDTFLGVQSDNKFYELDETVMRLILQLDKFEYAKGSDLHAKKISLLKQLHACGAILDQRTNDTAAIVDLEKQISETSSIIDQYSGSNEEYADIESRIENIRKKLEHTQVNNDLVVRKNGCKEHFSAIFNKFLTFSKPQIQTIDRGKGYVTHQYKFSVGNSKNPKDTLNEIGTRVEELKTKVMLFNDDENSLEYIAIDQELTELTFILNQLKIKKDSTLDKQKLNLMRYIQECTDILDERAGQVCSLKTIEKKLGDIGTKIQDEQLSDDDLNKLDERLITIQVKIGKLELHGDLSNRKQQCANMAQFYVKVVGELKRKIAKPPEAPTPM